MIHFQYVQLNSAVNNFLLLFSPLFSDSLGIGHAFLTGPAHLLLGSCLTVLNGWLKFSTLIFNYWKLAYYALFDDSPGNRSDLNKNLIPVHIFISNLNILFFKQLHKIAQLPIQLMNFQLIM